MMSRPAISRTFVRLLTVWNEHDEQLSYFPDLSSTSPGEMSMISSPAIFWTRVVSHLME